MTIDIPPVDFATTRNPMADELIVTQDLQRWAGQVADMLAANGRGVPADLYRLREGGALSRMRWAWLLDVVQRPRAGESPF